MEQLGITWFDVIATTVVALSAIMAFARGLIREVFSIIAFAGGALAAYFFNPMLRPLVESVTSLRGDLANIAAGIVIFLALFIVITIVISVVARTAHQSTEIGSFDRAAGVAFGVIRGVLIVSLLVLLVRQTTGAANGAPQAQIPEDFTKARTYPIYESVAKVFEHLLPQVRARAHDMIEHRESQNAGTATTEPSPTTESQP